MANVQGVLRKFEQEAQKSGKASVIYIDKVAKDVKSKFNKSYFNNDEVLYKAWDAVTSEINSIIRSGLQAKKADDVKRVIKDISDYEKGIKASPELRPLLMPLQEYLNQVLPTVQERVAKVSSAEENLRKFGGFVGEKSLGYVEGIARTALGAIPGASMLLDKSFGAIRRSQQASSARSSRLTSLGGVVSAAQRSLGDSGATVAAPISGGGARGSGGGAIAGESRGQRLEMRREEEREDDQRWATMIGLLTDILNALGGKGAGKKKKDDPDDTTSWSDRVLKYLGLGAATGGTAGGLLFGLKKMFTSIDDLAKLTDAEIKSKKTLAKARILELEADTKLSQENIKKKTVKIEAELKRYDTELADRREAHRKILKNQKILQAEEVDKLKSNLDAEYKNANKTERARLTKQFNKDLTDLGIKHADDLKESSKLLKAQNKLQLEAIEIGQDAAKVAVRETTETLATRSSSLLSNHITKISELDDLGDAAKIAKEAAKSGVGRVATAAAVKGSALATTAAESVSDASKIVLKEGGTLTKFAETGVGKIASGILKGIFKFAIPVEASVSFGKDIYDIWKRERSSDPLVDVEQKDVLGVIGSIVGGIFGAIGGPMGVFIGASAGNLVGEIIGTVVDSAEGVDVGIVAKNLQLGFENERKRLEEKLAKAKPEEGKTVKEEDKLTEQQKESINLQIESIKREQERYKEIFEKNDERMETRDNIIKAEEEIALLTTQIRDAENAGLEVYAEKLRAVKQNLEGRAADDKAFLELQRKDIEESMISMNKNIMTWADKWAGEEGIFGKMGDLFGGVNLETARGMEKEFTAKNKILRQEQERLAIMQKFSKGGIESLSAEEKKTYQNLMGERSREAGGAMTAGSWTRGTDHQGMTGLDIAQKKVGAAQAEAQRIKDIVKRKIGTDLILAGEAGDPGTDVITKEQIENWTKMGEKAKEKNIKEALTDLTNEKWATGFMHYFIPPKEGSQKHNFKPEEMALIRRMSPEKWYQFKGLWSKAYEDNKEWYVSTDAASKSDRGLHPNALQRQYDAARSRINAVESGRVTAAKLGEPDVVGDTLTYQALLKNPSLGQDIPLGGWSEAKRYWGGGLGHGEIIVGETGPEKMTVQGGYAQIYSTSSSATGDAINALSRSREVGGTDGNSIVAATNNIKQGDNYIINNYSHNVVAVHGSSPSITV